MEKHFDDELNELENEHLLKRAALILVEEDLRQLHALKDDDSIPEPEQAELDRIRDNITQFYLQSERKKNLKVRSKKTIRVTLVLAAALSILFTATFFSVGAFRQTVTDFFYQSFDKYSDVKVNQEGYYFVGKPEGWQSEYYPTYLPERFTFSRIFKDKFTKTIQYYDDQKQLLQFTISEMGKDLAVDTENRTEVQYEVNGVPATLFRLIGSDIVGISWHNDTTVFHIEGSLTDEEVIQIAQNINNL